MGIANSVAMSVSRSIADKLTALGTSGTGGTPTPAAPVFTLQPTNQSALDGATLTLTSRASGYPAPTYQWEVDSGAGWSEVSGATNRVYSFIASDATDGNEYRCVATNSEGTATSNEVVATTLLASALLLETGDTILLETNDRLLLEV